MTDPLAKAAGTAKITGIEITHHRLPLDPAFHASWDTQPRRHFDATLVRVHTDIGLSGIASGDTMLGFAGHEHLFIGQDALAIERHWRVLNNIQFHWGRPWPLDLALWDLAGKITGQPSGNCSAASPIGLRPMRPPERCAIPQRWRMRPSATLPKGSQP